MEKEIWKDIDGYEGLYQVSNLGRVRSLDRTVVCENGKKLFLKRKILKPFKSNVGYLKIALAKNNKAKRFLIHRLVAAEFLPNLNNYPIVNHLDGNKQNNCVENLEWTTQSENMQHAYKFGLMKKGAESPCAKFTQNQIQEIRQLYSTGSFSQRALAEKYGVEKKTIFSIVHNKSYKPD